MSGPIVKYETAPALSLNYPDCGACLVEVEMDADGMQCPRCGTTWSHNDGDGDAGTLYEEWAGEDNEGETRTLDNGYEPTESERVETAARRAEGLGAYMAKLERLNK